MTAPIELKRLYRQGRLVPFIGAGVSRSVEWVHDGASRHGIVWREFVEQAARMLGFSDPELLRVRGTDLQILEYFKLKRESLAPLNNWLYSQMQPPEDALRDSAIHRELAALGLCSVYYTTNYDDFLERSFELAGRPTTAIASESHMGAHPSVDQCEIVKFHGDFSFPDRMVITESDYQRRLSFGTPMDYRFRSDLLGRAILFLGYSFGDPNVAYLFHLVNEQLSRLPGSPSGRRAYIVVPNPSDFENTLFEARNIEVVPVQERTMTDDIAALLRDLRS
jgi:hypothetical protein